MTYQCIKCGRQWVVCNPSEYKSHGLCEECITIYIRRKQRKEGHNDCFKKAVENCNEPCKYHDWCCKDM